MDNGRRRSRKGSKPKTLSRAAMRSIVANEKVAEEFLNGLRDGTLVASRFQLGTVVRVLGGEHFDVELMDGPVVRASLAGVLKGRGGFFRNPEASTAVHFKSDVVVEDIGLGYMAGGSSHQIIAVLDEDQATEARRFMRRTSSESDAVARRTSSTSDNLFERDYTYVAGIRKKQVSNAKRDLDSLRKTAKRSPSKGSLRQTVKLSPSNAGYAVGSRKSSPSSSNIYAEMAAAEKDAKAAAENAKKAEQRAKKKEIFHRRKDSKKSQKAAATGGTAKWF